MKDNVMTCFNSIMKHHIVTATHVKSKIRYKFRFCSEKDAEAFAAEIVLFGHQSEHESFDTFNLDQAVHIWLHFCDVS